MFVNKLGFNKDIVPSFTPGSKVAVKRKLEELYTKEKTIFFPVLSSISPRKPSVIDYWTGCD